MPSIETYRKQAKQLVRWHRERNYSVGEKLRLIERYRHITDIEALNMPLPLTLAQEVVAVEAGFRSWAELKALGTGIQQSRARGKAAPVLRGVVPILFVRDVSTAVRFYQEKLGFHVDFSHGKPPFYASVSRDSACLHLRFVQRPNFNALAQQETSLILASFEVTDVKALFEDYVARGVEFPQRLVRQVWGGLDFHVRDPDGNVVSFVQYNTIAPSANDAG